MFLLAMRMGDGFKAAAVSATSVTLLLFLSRHFYVKALLYIIGDEIDGLNASGGLYTRFDYNVESQLPVICHWGAPSLWMCVDDKSHFLLCFLPCKNPSTCIQTLHCGVNIHKKHLCVRVRPEYIPNDVTQIL